MLSILDRYFLRELGQAVAAVAIVLMVIVAGGTFARVLQQVANGSFPISVMFPVLGLRLVDGLSGLLPLACFLGVMQALGRMYRESEMHVLASSGMGARGLLRPSLMLTVLLVVVVATVALWLGPLASRTSDAMVDQANRSVVAAGLDAGHFTELPGKGGIIFTDTISRDGTVMGRTFIAGERTRSDGSVHVNIVTGATGKLYQESNGSGRFIRLNDGWRFDVPLGALNWRKMKYESNDAALSSIAADDSDDATHNQTTLALFGATDADSRAELAWRIASPMTALVLLLLALPLSRQSPREPRYGRILLAVLGYFLYTTLLAICRNQIAKGHWHNADGMWLLHVLTLGLAAWMLLRQYSPRKQARGAGKPGGKSGPPAAAGVAA
jgi:lipopolysaccharide export system permease protein